MPSNIVNTRNTAILNDLFVLLPCAMLQLWQQLNTVLCTAVLGLAISNNQEQIIIIAGNIN